MMNSTILHCDLNSFFCSVACLDNPTIRNLPVAVCGSVEDRHGIVLAKNKFASACNVKTGEAIWQAKIKCPDLVTVPPNYNRYKEISNIARGIYSEYTDDVQPFGIDECWLDVTASRLMYGGGELIAKEISDRIKKEIGVTISAGVSFTRVFAKFGSDYKKPDAITVINKGDEKRIIWPKNVKELLGVGPNTAKKLYNMGIFTIGDLALADSGVLRIRFGKNGELLKNWALGNENSIPLGFHSLPIPKSISRSVTCVRDITNRQALVSLLLSLSEEVAKQLHQKHLYAGGVGLHIRNCDLAVKDINKKLDTPIRLSRQLAEEGLKLFDENCDFSRPVRSAGIKADLLSCEPDAFQTSMFFDALREQKEANLESRVFDIRDRFGEKSIIRCCNMETKENRLRPDYDKVGKPCSFGYL